MKFSLEFRHRSKSDPHKDRSSPTNSKHPQKSASAKAVIQTVPTEEEEVKNGNRLIEEEKVEEGQVRKFSFLKC